MLINQPNSQLSPKTAFWFFVAGGILTLGTLGFLFTLPAVLREGRRDDAAVTARPIASPSGQATGVALAAITDRDHVRGNRRAAVSVVEYSDLECPFCKRFHPTMQQVLQTYGDKVNWVYRHFPLDSIHSKARKEAEATECAGEIGGNEGFWEYVDRLFAVTPSNNGLDPAQLPQIAQDVGLSRAKFEACLNSGKYAAHVAEDLADAIAAGGTGTPYSVIVAGNQKIPVSGAVPFSQLQAMLDPLVR